VLVSAVAFFMAAYVLSQEMKNWQSKHEELQAKYDKDVADLNKKLKDAQDNAKDADDKRQTAEGKRDEYERLTKEQATSIKTLQDDLAALKKAKDALDISFDKISGELKVLNDKNTTLTTDNDTLQKEKDAALKAQKKAEDDLAKEQDDNRRLRNMLKLRTAERDALREETVAWVSVYGNDGIRLTRAVMKKPVPPMINGRVNNANNASGIVEVTVGKDDGLNEGQTLKVVRPEAGVFVGCVRVETVYDERAICRIDRKMTRSVIRRGDHVTTRIK